MKKIDLDTWPLLQQQLLLLLLFGYNLRSTSKIKEAFQDFIEPTERIGIGEIRQVWKALKAANLGQEENGAWVLSPDADRFLLMVAFANYDRYLLADVYNVTLQRSSGSRWWNSRWMSGGVSFQELFALLQASIVLNQGQRFFQILEIIESGYTGVSDRQLEEVYSYLFDTLLAPGGEYVPHIGSDLKAWLVNSHFYDAISRTGQIRPDLSVLAEAIIDEGEIGSHALQSTYALALLLQGKWTRLQRLIDRHPGYFIDLAKGSLHLVQGNTRDSAVAFRQGIADFRDQVSERKRQMQDYPPGSLLFFWFLSAVEWSTAEAIDEWTRGVQHFEQVQGVTIEEAGVLLEVFIALRQNQEREALKLLRDVYYADPLSTLMMGIIYVGAQLMPDEEQRTELVELYEKACRHEYTWMRMELAGVLAYCTPNADQRAAYQEDYTHYAEILSARSLTGLFQERAPWERITEGLSRFFSERSATDTRAAEREQRLIGLLAVDGEPEVVLKIQSVAKRGGWTAGRKVTYNLAEQYLDAATPEERPILQQYLAMEQSTSWWYESYDKDTWYVLEALVGFERIYLLDNPKVQVELVRAQPKMFLEQDGHELRVLFNFLPQDKSGYSIFKTSPTQYTLVQFTEEQLDFLYLFGREQVVFPEAASAQVLDFLDRIRGIMEVETVLEEDLTALPQHSGDATPHVHLLRSGDSFQLEWYVKPHTGVSRYFHPGQGRTRYKEVVDEKAFVVERDLDAEATQFQRVYEQLTLPPEAQTTSWQWLLASAEDCLTVLQELAPLRAGGAAVVEWPKGQTLGLTRSLDLDDLKMGLAKGKEYWLTVDGKVEVDESLVFGLKKLLEWSQDGHSRFVEISDGQFIGLTRRLQRKLQQARTLLDGGKGEQMKVHQLAGTAVEELFADAGSWEVDRRWEEQKEHLAKAQNIRPRVPSGFQATLRPYQKDGFRWLMRLAAWGVGGCLADDMGLGKTIQALAVMAARAKQGPALVVAPASVARNWQQEATTFTPHLRPLLFGRGDREQMLAELTAGDILICSYGLMQSEIERLQEIPFQMIVLDEAQAIKNAATKRFKAAMKLQGDFRVATTGTPIENHLGELWSLFAFINPGLLGGKKRFNERFANPIKQGDKGALEQLRKLIQPFILRRRKSQVLKELPPKTEIQYTVELPPAERAFYEASRRFAVEKLEQKLEEEQAGTQHLLILAELTRLRRACCHPSLVDPNSSLAGAKLQAFQELVTELLEGEHRVLVFSQFVDFLRLVQKWVEKEKIPHQYLDGSTSLPQRSKAVQAFQRGEGEVFLISLKAGGVGLNLTAADYVIILDPWWNPAVEAQAADRAHRIGQQNPVTVYRLLTEHTIEEKIVALHEEKKELADNLLQGAEQAGRISAEQLLNILKEER